MTRLPFVGPMRVRATMAVPGGYGVTGETHVVDEKFDDIRCGYGVARCGADGHWTRVEEEVDCERCQDDAGPRGDRVGGDRP